MLGELHTVRESLYTAGIFYTCEECEKETPYVKFRKLRMRVKYQHRLNLTPLQSLAGLLVLHFGIVKNLIGDDDLHRTVPVVA